MRKSVSIFSVVISAFVACTVKPPPVIVTSEKTALENQLLGSSELITEDPLAVTAVWSREFAPGTYSPVEIEPSTRETADDTRRLILAQIRRQTLQDHIEQLKRSGLLGERAGGFLAIVPDSLARNEELMRIVAAENTDRRIIWDYYAAASGEDQADALASIKTTFAELAAKLSPTGTWIEDDQGQWSRK